MLRAELSGILLERRFKFGRAGQQCLDFDGAHIPNKTTRSR